MANIISKVASGELKQLDVTEQNSLYDYILDYFVNNVPNRTGSLNTSGQGTNLGTFTDTSYQGATGSSDTTVVSTTYMLSMVDTPTLTTTPTSPHPIGLNVVNSNLVELQEGLSTIEDVADDILSRMVSGTYGGIGSYWVGTSAPTDGGTWVTIATIDDTTENQTTLQNRYFVYQKITDSFPATPSVPMKLVSGPSIQSFTQTEVENISKTIEERIVSTGVGQYTFQENEPTIGTWIPCGTINDLRRTTGTSYTSESTYTSETPIVYASTVGYEGSNATTFTSTQFFTGFTPTSYTSETSFVQPGAPWPFNSGLEYYLGDASYEGPDSPFPFNGPLTEYVGPGSVSYFGSNQYYGPGTYIGEVSYVGFHQYTGTLPPSFYIGEQTFVGPGAQSYTSTQFFTGFVPVTYTVDNNYTGTEFIDYIGSQSYTGTGSQSYTSSQSYTGTVPSNYTSTIDYTGIVNYAGTPTFTSPGSTYTGTVTTTFFGPPNNFFGPGGSYTGPPSQVSYVADVNYTGPSTANFGYFGTENYIGDGPASTFSSGPTTYTSQFSVTYTGGGNYLGPIYYSYTGSTAYTGTTTVGYQFQPASYAGPPGPTSYLGPDAVYFGTETVNYISESTYTVEGLTFYDGPQNSYTVDTFNSYVGLAPSYSGPPSQIQYFAEVPYYGPGESSYFGSVSYIGDGPAPTFSGTTTYTGPGSAFFGPTPANFTSPTSFYTGPETNFSGNVNYTSDIDYTGSNNQAFTNSISYSGPSYGNQTIQSSTEIITSLTLWRRVG